MRFVKWSGAAGGLKNCALRGTGSLFYSFLRLFACAAYGSN